MVESRGEAIDARAYSSAESGEICHESDEATQRIVQNGKKPSLGEEGRRTDVHLDDAGPLGVRTASREASGTQGHGNGQKRPSERGNDHVSESECVKRQRTTEEARSGSNVNRRNEHGRRHDSRERREHRDVGRHRSADDHGSRRSESSHHAHRERGERHSSAKSSRDWEASRHHERERKREHRMDRDSRDGRQKDKSRRSRHGSKRSRSRDRERHDRRSRSRSRERTRRGSRSDREKEQSFKPKPEVPQDVAPEGVRNDEDEIEQRRKRIAAIKARHEDACAVVNPTASARAEQQPAEATPAPGASATPEDSAGNVAGGTRSSSPKQKGDENGDDTANEAGSGGGDVGTAGLSMDSGVKAAADEAKDESRQLDEEEQGEAEMEEDGSDEELLDVLGHGDAVAAPLPSPEQQELIRHMDDDRQDRRHLLIRATSTKPPTEGQQAGTEQEQARTGGGAPGGEDGDDMFGDDFDETLNVAGTRGEQQQSGLFDAYDDQDGYYKFQVGEIVDNRYELQSCSGQGVFSRVVISKDRGRQDEHGQHPQVAIKVIRSNEHMCKEGLKEIDVLTTLARRDPQDKRHCVRLLRHFMYRNHLCLVFEALEMNLRELTKKIARGVGINIHGVQRFSAQLMMALRLTHECGIIHADIKPDNVLVSHNRRRIKLCDFGSAMRCVASEVMETPYLVSRFYRAPEIILGMRYDYAVDMWSVGCVLYELLTSKILFPGRTNNEMLKLMMEVKGALPKRMIKMGKFSDAHFADDPNRSFVAVEEDPITKKPVRRMITNPVAKHGFRQLIGEPARRDATYKKEDLAKVDRLVDLLDRMMELDPDRRIKPEEALRHPFILPLVSFKPHTAAGKQAKPE